MIDWFSRVEPQRPFLKTDSAVWSYAETRAEIESRLSPDPVVLTPELEPQSVFELLAGISGGGAMVVGQGEAPTDVPFPTGHCLVVFTSGSSGRPKGVRLTLDNLVAASRASMTHLGHGGDDTWLLAMPLTHVGGISIMVRSAFAGGSVRLQPGFDVARFCAALHDDVTMVSVVPTMLHRILDYDPGPFEGLRAVLVGGGPTPEGLLERAADAGMPVLPTYGMTETFGQVATLLPGSPLLRRAHPLPGIELRTMPDGRIAVRGPQVSPGYLNEPDRDQEWLVTGDLGEVDSDGALRVLGRADTLIITGGENVDPARVEDEIAAHPGIGHALVVGVPDEEWGSLVVCLYEGEVLSSDLEEWSKQHLPPHMVPKRWVRVGSIPRTPLGKPDRQAALVLCLGDSS